MNTLAILNLRNIKIKNFANKLNRIILKKNTFDEIKDELYKLEDDNFLFKTDKIVEIIKKIIKLNSNVKPNVEFDELMKMIIMFTNKIIINDLSSDIKTEGISTWLPFSNNILKRMLLLKSEISHSSNYSDMSNHYIIKIVLEDEFEKFKRNEHNTIISPTLQKINNKLVNVYNK
jgi:hypothetical protein